MPNSKENIAIKEAEVVKNECFVIMPISDPDGYPNNHFKRVYEDIFIPAIRQAGFTEFRADDNKASSLIELEIIRKLIECPVAICDLSSRNPNVLFELGVRQAFDKPVVLVQECNTPRIFDISSINTIEYRRERLYHEVLEDQKRIAAGITETIKNWKEGKSINSIVKLLSLKQPASLKNTEEIKKDPAIQFIMNEISALREEVRADKSRSTITIDDAIINDGNKKYLLLRGKLVDMLADGEIPSQEILNEVAYLSEKYRSMAKRTNNVDILDIARRYEHLYYDSLRNGKIFQDKG